MEEYKRQNTLKYIKYWLFAVVIISIIALLLQFIINNSEDVQLISQTDRAQLRSITPAYPPPLVNFMN